jgi:hypothetical protein
MMIQLSDSTRNRIYNDFRTILICVGTRGLILYMRVYRLYMKMQISWYLQGCVGANGYSSVGNLGGCGPAGCIAGGQ